MKKLLLILAASFAIGTSAQTTYTTSADQSTTTTALTPVSGLQFAVLADTVYKVDGTIYVTGTYNKIGVLTFDNLITGTTNLPIGWIDGYDGRQPIKCGKTVNVGQLLPFVRYDVHFTFKATSTGTFSFSYSNMYNGNTMTIAAGSYITVK